jgi:hypothetical protein
MQTQSETYGGGSYSTIESLFAKVRANLDLLMKVLEVVRNEQSSQWNITMRGNPNRALPLPTSNSKSQMI